MTISLGGSVSAALHQRRVVVTSHLFGVNPMVSCGRAAQSNGRPSIEAMTGHERRPRLGISSG